jgi:hypothetical protein
MGKPYFYAPGLPARNSHQYSEIKGSYNVRIILSTAPTEPQHIMQQGKMVVKCEVNSGSK